MGSLQCLFGAQNNVNKAFSVTFTWHFLATFAKHMPRPSHFLAMQIVEDTRKTLLSRVLGAFSRKISTKLPDSLSRVNLGGFPCQIKRRIFLFHHKFNRCTALLAYNWVFRGNFAFFSGKIQVEISHKKFRFFALTRHLFFFVFFYPICSECVCCVDCFAGNLSTFIRGNSGDF